MGWVGSFVIALPLSGMQVVTQAQLISVSQHDRVNGDQGGLS